MNDAQLHELAAPYAVDALEQDEREAFEAHLAGCPACQGEVRELQEATVGLSEGLETEPPADLRRRILAQVALEAPAARDDSRVAGHQAAGTSGAPSRRARGAGRAGGAGPAAGARGWVLAAAAALLVGTGTWAAVQLVAGEDSVTSVVQAKDAVEREVLIAEGRVVVITSEEQDAAVLQVPEGLPATDAGQVYQAWFVGADGAARSAGLLEEDALTDGEVRLEGAVADAAAVGLTVEPAGGSEQPTTEPVAVVPLG